MCRRGYTSWRLHEHECPGKSWRGVAREPRGAAGGAAFNRSRRSTSEPSPDPHRPPEPKQTRGRPEQIRARISELTAHRHSASFQNHCKHHGAQPRRVDGAGPRHPAHHDDAQRDRGDARGAASRNTKGCSIPMETSPRAPRLRLAPVAAGRGGRVAAAPPRRAARARPNKHARNNRNNRDAHFITTQAPSSTRTTGPSTSSRRASAPSSRPLALVPMMSRTPTRLPLGARPLP